MTKSTDGKEAEEEDYNESDKVKANNESAFEYEKEDQLQLAWEEVYDEEYQCPYYYNHNTGDTIWDKPEDFETLKYIPDSVDSNPVEMNEEDLLAKYDGMDYMTWVFSEFSTPVLVDLESSRRQAPAVWYGVRKVSDLVRLNVIRLKNPDRHMFTTEEPQFGKPPVFSFLVFKEEMPHTYKYYIEETHDWPTRYRISREKKKTQPRDISNWRRIEKNHFWAYPNLGIQGTTSLHVEWEPGPDRYFLNFGDNIAGIKQRCYSFYGYKVQKISIYRGYDPPKMKLVREEIAEIEGDWKLIGSFFALTEPMMGATKIYVQELMEPFHRTRIAMNPKNVAGWQDIFSFYAFDLAIPGTSRYTVSQIQSNPRTRLDLPEQYTLSDLGRAPKGHWNWRFDFFAFPNPAIFHKGFVDDED